VHINWMNYRFWNYDGYGRFGRYFVRALARQGLRITPMLVDQFTEVPGWMRRMAGLDFSRITITCMPPHCLPALPGRVWLMTMCEGTRIHKEWIRMCNEKAERVLVPCEHNAEAFKASGVRIPIHVVPGGTSPSDFPLVHRNGRRQGSYTFLALGDRGSRKGWVAVWQAFFKAFEAVDDVRLLIKYRPGGNDLLDTIAGAANRDPRITFWRNSVDNPADVYLLADCFAIPSKSEGWGMPHREAAMMGIPVIATRYSGLADGIDGWATRIIDDFKLSPVPSTAQFVFGEWAEPDEDAVAEAMRWCYDHPAEANARAARCAQWLREYQTWDQAAANLIELLGRYG